MTYLLIVPLFIILISFFFLSRNQAVFKFRRKIIETVSSCAKNDCELGNDWKWRFDTLQTVSYDKMLFTFWKRLKVENFYEDDSFIINNEEKHEE